MLNTALNKADLIYLLLQQIKLDQAIQKEHKIKSHHWLLRMEKEHKIALNVEIHEFINECFKVWKYWKKKEMDMDKLIDEAIDVIHFCMLQINKNNVDLDYTAQDVVDHNINRRTLCDRNQVKDVLYRLSTQPNRDVKVILGDILVLLDYYGFTTSDVLSAYNKKNKVNFERMINNY